MFPFDSFGFISDGLHITSSRSVLTYNLILTIYLFQLSEVFEQEIDPVMQALGYCCGRKYTFNPQVLCCYGKQLCTIPRDAKYFSYQNRYVLSGLMSLVFTGQYIQYLSTLSDTPFAKNVSMIYLEIL